MEIINNSNPLIGSNTNVQRLENSQKQERIQKSDGGPNLDADRLELSVRSREISRFDELVRLTPDVRENKVEQVRREIEAGTYNVKAEKIAEKIIGGGLLNKVG
jgi:negative regulator of flagellin synthesis FlgM